MARPLKNPHETSFESFASQFALASMSLGRFMPAVWASPDDEKYGKAYGMRVLVSQNRNLRSGATRTTWDYFYMDKTGLITSSPHGMGGDYNGRVRVTGLEAAVKKYKDKPVNHG